MAVTDEQRPYGGNAPTDPALKRVRTRHFQRAKEQGIKITGLTSYDFLSARDLRRGRHRLPARRRLGRQHRVRVRHDHPGHRRRADPAHPRRRAAVQRAFVIADMPFGSYENGPDEALATAIRFMKETGCHAVKLRGRRAQRQADQADRPGRHPGDGPHRVHAAERARARRPHHPGARRDGAEQLLADAHAVEEAGAFAVVLEMVPSAIAGEVTKELSIPTISVGAGPNCDGQLLVWSDWAGFHARPHPEVRQAVRPDRRRRCSTPPRRFSEDVESGVYPAPEHEYAE